jgi:hypothetical protein
VSGRRPAQRLLLAGSSGDERQPARLDPRVPRWFEPEHVRDLGSARTRIAGQVAAGADVVVAPAWRSHRRALVDVGEARRAREWTLAAVAVAREGVEMGLEERDRRMAADPRANEPIAADPRANEPIADEPIAAEPGAVEPGAAEPVAKVPPERPTPLVAGPLPVLDAETGAGRLLPQDAAAERDHRDQAGILSDADVDLLLVETLPASGMARVAVEAAVSTGLPVWVAAVRGATGASLAELERWADEAVAAGAELLLAGVPRLGDPAAAGGDDPSRVAPRDGDAAITPVATVLARAAADGWGGLLDPAAGAPASPGPLEASRGWLMAGARVLGLLAGADPVSLAPAREAIDAVETAELNRRAVAEARWRAALSTAARMAPGGAGLWLGDSEPAWLPSGFDWLVASPAAARQLPEGRYRLIVEAERAVGLPTLAALLDRGGVLTRPVDDGDTAGDPRVRLVRVEAGTRPALGVWRRED